MSKSIEREFQSAMNDLAFSSREKKRLLDHIMYADRQNTESEVSKMKKWSFQKAAAIAFAAVMVTGGTAFAASKILYYEAGSPSSYEYTSAVEMNASENASLFPESLGNGFVFDGGNNVTVSGKDEAGNTLDKWTDLMAVYNRPDGASVSLNVSKKMPEDDGRTPTETREIAGTTVVYNYDEYLLLPSEEDALTPEVEARLETDEHFYVSYGGGTEPETWYYSGVSFIKDKISYYLFSADDITADELFSMAGELLKR